MRLHIILRAAGAVLLLLALPRAALAVPVSGEWFRLAQPDGIPLEVRIRGDKFYRIAELVDGHTVVPDPASGEICYARLSPERDAFVSTGVRVARGSGAGLGLPRHLRLAPEVVRALAGEVRAELAIEGRKTGPPSLGDVKALCLLVDFSDEPAAIPSAEVDDYCNLIGYNGLGNNGSVRDYFAEVSGDLLDYTNFVPDAWFRASNPQSYYDDCGAPCGMRAREMTVEALQVLDQNGFDFSQYDANGDGSIDGVDCFHAGL